MSLVGPDDALLYEDEVESAGGRFESSSLRDALGAIKGVDAVGHRVVHGGARYTASVRIDAGLVAATRRYDAPPVWVVSGTSAAGVKRAAGLLDEASLRDHYAVAVEGGEETPLPLR